jgi:hypothetical protein
MGEGFSFMVQQSNSKPSKEGQRWGEFVTQARSEKARAVQLFFSPADSIWQQDSVLLGDGDILLGHSTGSGIIPGVMTPG